MRTSVFTTNQFYTGRFSGHNMTWRTACFRVIAIAFIKDGSAKA